MFELQNSAQETVMVFDPFDDISNLIDEFNVQLQICRIDKGNNGTLLLFDENEDELCKFKTKESDTELVTDFSTCIRSYIVDNVKDLHQYPDMPKLEDNYAIEGFGEMNTKHTQDEIKVIDFGLRQRKNTVDRIDREEYIHDQMNISDSDDETKKKDRMIVYEVKKKDMILGTVTGNSVKIASKKAYDEFMINEKDVKFKLTDESGGVFKYRAIEEDGQIIIVKR